MPSEMVDYHPLVCHMIDTAMVVQSLWDEVLPLRFRTEMSAVLGSSDQARPILSFLAACHDIGKGTPEFAGKWPAARKALLEASCPFPTEIVTPTRGLMAVPHWLMTAVVLPDLLRQDGVPEVLSDILAAIVGGHHGLIPSSMKVDNTPLAFHGDTERASVWQQLRYGIYSSVKTLVGADFTGVDWERVSRCPWFVMKLAGLTSVSDWIASDEDHFPYAIKTPGQALDLKQYAQEALVRARMALDTLGWTGWTPSSKTYSFQELFEYTPRPLQETIVDLAGSQLDLPSLVLIEAPMGEGKTEAALYLQDWLQATAGQRGMYVALPTQATSNSMFSRVVKFLRRRYPSEKVNLHLMHANAVLNDDYQSLRAIGVIDDEDSDRASVVAEEWFTPKKRGLLSPFGVGTVDQALLSVLWVKHGFVRLFGLSDKVVILDEVHAYDVYTSTLIDGLVTWLRELGASVVLLSATLPSHRRRKLISAFSGKQDFEETAVSYPRVTWVTESGSSGSVGFGASHHRTVSIKRMGSDRESIARALVEVVSKGGCATWICNTVVRSQEIYRILKPLCRQAGIQLDLFHAKFPLNERLERERRAVDGFGKNSLLVGKPEYKPRPKKAILVATQVVEQSLDLDFDLMVTDVAPIDLILQRMGRMHRHERENRPPHLDDPTLWIAEPPVDADGIPDFSADSCIYSEYILLKSWYEILQRDTIRTPEDIEYLIERVYSPSVDMEFSISPAQRDSLAEAKRKDDKRRSDDEKQARDKLLHNPDAELLFLDDHRLDLAEDDQDASPKLQAATRLCLPSVQVVCAYQQPDGRLSLDADGKDLIETDSVPSLEDAKKLLRRSVTLSYPGVVRALREKPVPSGWKRSALLRNHRLIGFVGNAYEIDGWQLELNEELGIVIHK